MVQLMSDEKSSLKLQAEDSLEYQLGLPSKRSKLDSSLQMIPTASLCYALDDPCPLGLRLKKSASLLDLIQMKLSQENNSKKDHKASGRISAGKLKASTFPASLLKIGSWEYKSRHEGDLVAKCYFAKRKLVWEVLDGGLKNKIEIQLSHIVAIKANFPDDGPETLEVALARQPLYFRETDPQPRRHTLWQETSDFTGGQANIHRGHLLQCNPGILEKHFEKLIQYDPHLNFLSQQSEICLEGPYFEQRFPLFCELNESSEVLDFKDEEKSSVFALEEAASPSGFHSSSINDENQAFIVRTPESTSEETPSPSTVIDTDAIEEISSLKTDRQKVPSRWDQKVPGLQPSMSTGDQVKHLGQCISEQTSSDPAISHDERKYRDILEEIAQFLFSDSQLTSATDEQHLMSRINSLCCLLQRDPGSARNSQDKSCTYLEVDGDGNVGETKSINPKDCMGIFVEGFALPQDQSSSVYSCKQAPTISKEGFI